MDTDAGRIRVWDLFIRIFHWTTAVGFAVAYVSEDILILHVWAGYVIGGLLVLRILWGLVGPRHARFADFIYAPATVLAYLRDLAAFRATRFLGHSPAGGAMVVALMLGLGATVWSGLELYAVEEKAGPLATGAPVGQAPRLTAPRAGDDDDARHEGERDDGESVWEEIHEAAADITLILVILHIAGVALASAVHRENLARSMVTGMKRADE